MSLTNRGAGFLRSCKTRAARGCSPVAPRRPWSPGDRVPSASVRRLLLLALLVVAVAALGACGGGGDEPEDDGPAPLATPESIRTAIWERSFSECASTSLKRLALKYGVEPKRDEVTLAVGEAWSDRFSGADDAVRAGRDGCRQGLAAS